jgi:hypothetical protein
MTMNDTSPEIRPAAPPSLDDVSFDLYRDVHKAIRVELFSVTSEAGRVDPSDQAARMALADHVKWVVEWLAQHAHHEDVYIEPDLCRLMPDLAAVVRNDHISFDTRCDSLLELATDAVSATGTARRRLGHRLYLDLALFTSDYLAHQDIEERLIMPCLEAALGLPRILEIQHSILASISPEDMGTALSLMIPAINLDDRAEMLGGIRSEAPPEAFDAVWALAGSVLTPDQHRDLGLRLGIG